MMQGTDWGVTAESHFQKPFAVATFHNDHSMVCVAARDIDCGLRSAPSASAAHAAPGASSVWMFLA